MVMIERSGLQDQWQTIKQSAAASPDAITVLVLVALDVDAVATCAMFSWLLESEEITHNVKPVRDYSALTDIYASDIVDNDELRCVLLINCGARIDLQALLQGRLDELDNEREGGARVATEVPHAECRWLVLDSHLPLNLENAQRENMYFVTDGQPHAERDELVAQAHILYDSEFEGESDDEDDGPPTQRRRLGVEEYAQMSPDSRATQYRRVRALSKRYYTSSWHGTASSVLAYTLVQALNRTCNQLLWYAIAGLTDQLVHERVEHEQYVHEAQALQLEVAALNDDGGDAAAETHADADSGVSVVVPQHVCSSMRLESVQELRLSLLRHWSLYESLRHSTYVYTRLGLYQQKGRSNLDVWLARMGIPLEECRQNYAYMRKAFKDELFDRMLQYGQEFGLHQLTYPSFRCVTNYTTTITAADLVHCVNAQLEDVGSAAADGTMDGARAGFNEAVRTLTRTSAREGAQTAGLDKAKRLLRSLVSQGNAIIAQRQYKYLGDFYKVVLKPSSESATFAENEFALTKLGLFVADALREGSKHKEPKPLVIAAPKKLSAPDSEETPTYLVVAVLGSARHWTASGKNSFAAAFHDAATDDNVHARVAIDGFESTICQVAQADLENFLAGVVSHYTPDA